MLGSKEKECNTNPGIGQRMSEGSIIECSNTLEETYSKIIKHPASPLLSNTQYFLLGYVFAKYHDSGITLHQVGNIDIYIYIYQSYIDNKNFGHNWLSRRTRNDHFYTAKFIRVFHLRRGVRYGKYSYPIFIIFNQICTRIYDS